MKAFSRVALMSLIVLIGYALSGMSQGSNAPKPVSEAHQSYTPSRIEWMEVWLNSQGTDTSVGRIQWRIKADTLTMYELASKPDDPKYIATLEQIANLRYKEAETELKDRGWDKAIKLYRNNPFKK